MTKRMIVAILSLVGVFLATYLTLYKLGYIEALACGTGSCEVVQSSKWSKLFGQPVALWGLCFYVAMFALSFVGTFGALAESRRIGIALALMSACGVVFSGWLTFVELWLLHAICRYCVVSAGIVLVLFVLSVTDVTRASAASSGPMRPPA